MEPRDWVLVVAMIIAPLFAVQVQKWIERFRERKGKKLRIFNREGLVSILSGKKPFPIKIFSAEDSIGKLNLPTEKIS